MYERVSRKKRSHLARRIEKNNNTKKKEKNKP